jgi:hypothetical protein
LRSNFPNLGFFEHSSREFRPSEGIVVRIINAFTIAVIAWLGIALSTSGNVAAQTAKNIVGDWTLISSDTVSPSGARTPTLGSNPTGRVTFTSDGHFIWLFINNDLPKFAANNRAAGTPDENAAVIKGSISVYGTYSVSDKDLVFKIEQSTFPNWKGTEQKRSIVVITADELKWTNPAGSTGGIAELAFKRAK